MSGNQAGDEKSIEEKRRKVARASAQARSDNLAKAFEEDQGMTMEQWKRAKIGMGMSEQSANNIATSMAEDALKKKNEEDRQPAEDFAARIEKSQAAIRAVNEERARLSGKTATERGEGNDA